MNKKFLLQLLKKYLKVLYNFIDYELYMNNHYFTDIDLYIVDFLYESLEKIFEGVNMYNLNDLCKCKECYYNDIKNVCCSVKSKFFMCKTDSEIVIKDVKVCFRTKEEK